MILKINALAQLHDRSSFRCYKFDRQIKDCPIRGRKISRHITIGTDLCLPIEIIEVGREGVTGPIVRACLITHAGKNGRTNSHGRETAIRDKLLAWQELDIILDESFCKRSKANLVSF
jgi:hypothetical protein